MSIHVQCLQHASIYAFVDRYSNSADKIYTAVNEMCDLFPTVRTACLLLELHVDVQVLSVTAH